MEVLVVEGKTQKKRKIVDVDENENERREKQRKKQQLAREKQQLGGLTKKEIKLRRKNGQPIPKITPKVPLKPVAAVAEQDIDASGPKRNHDVVIIPIFWRNVAGQEDAIVREAQRIKALLAKASLDVWVDRTHKLTPGQKLNFWENAGVRWRVEIGPKDAVKQRCVVSYQSGAPGDFSSVRKITVSSVKSALLLSKLRDDLSLTKIKDSGFEFDGAFDSKQLTMSRENLKAITSGADEEHAAPKFVPSNAPTRHEVAAPPAFWAGAVDKSNAKERPAAPIATGVGSVEKMNAKERRALRRSEAQRVSGDDDNDEPQGAPEPTDPKQQSKKGAQKLIKF